MHKIHDVVTFTGWSRGENTGQANAVRFFDDDKHTDFPIIGWVDRQGGFAVPVVESHGEPVDLVAVIGERIDASPTGVVRFDTVWP